MTDDSRYEAVRGRGPRFDGVFFTCVRTTGIFCRPSCPAVIPKRANVAFRPSAAGAPLKELGTPEARRDALRTLADGTVRLDAGADRDETTRALLTLRGTGPWTAGYIRMRALGDPDVFPDDDAGARHGLRAHGSRPGRHRALAPLAQLRPPPPLASPHDGVPLMTTTPIRTVHPTPLGDLILTGDGETLASLSVAGQGNAAAHAEGTTEDPSAFAAVREQLDAYFAGRLTVFDVPFRARGTEFRERVWAALDEIPYGTTVTYSGLADRAGAPRSAVRAIGGAVGANPLMIVRPCHRVVGANGTLTGFAGGLEAKAHLLGLEGITF